jgi:hypothetical protein
MDDTYQVYEKMGSSLEIKINSKGEGTLTAKVNFLMADRLNALDQLHKVIADATKDAQIEPPVDDGEVVLGEIKPKKKESYGIRLPSKQVNNEE